jgi:hypothetical protein
LLGGAKLLTGRNLVARELILFLRQATGESQRRNDGHHPDRIQMCYLVNHRQLHQVL